MKIIIIALFVSFAIATTPNVTISGAVNSADACEYDVTVTVAALATATSGNAVYAVVAECTTAPTDGAIANLKTAGCSFVGLKGAATTTFTLST